MCRVVVDGVEPEIGFGEFELEEVGTTSEMQRGGFGERPGAGLEEVGDVLAAERLEGAGIIESARGGLGAVDLAERDDLVHVMSRVEPSQLELCVVELGFWGQGEEALEELLMSARAGPMVEGLAGAFIGAFLASANRHLTEGDGQNEGAWSANQHILFVLCGTLLGSLVDASDIYEGAQRPRIRQCMPFLSFTRTSASHVLR